MKEVKFIQYHETAQVYSGLVYCPECEQLAQFEGNHEVGCEDCGEHSAIKCLNCGEYFDHVWGFEKIDDYNEERGIRIV